jgi:para-nitrobenzyl esterase
VTPPAEIKTTAGVVRCADPAVHGGASAFLGIPYAEPPTGVNRFGAPTPVIAWDGVRPCDTYGASAPQPAQGFTIIPEPIVPGDNCLNLNVFTPEPSEGANLPVLVWIHGGGFVNGCNASPWYHGRSFCRDGVVVVAINYRLGIEGFLPLADAPANRALLDWILALEWVQENVGRFGGDPGRVTIAGQSAGGMACATLLAAPRARGLFRQAMLMSGTANFLRPLGDAHRFAARVADALGISPTRDAFSSVDERALIDVQQSFGGVRETGGDDDAVTQFAALATKGLRYGPVVDGDLVPESPLEAVRSGSSRDVPVVIGTTAEEVDALAGFAADLRDDTLLDGLRRAGLSSDDAAGYRNSFSDEPAGRVLGRAMTDVMFRVPAVRVAEARAGSATFAYEFQWRSPTGFGSVHCLDLPFVFDVLDAEAVPVVAGDDPPRTLADAMHAAWVEFIVDGDPGWPAYDVTERPVMVFDHPPTGPVSDPHARSRSRFAGFA